MKLHRVRRFPSIEDGREPNCIYLEKGASDTYFNIFVTGATADVYSRSFNGDDAAAIISNGLTNSASFETVANIEIRDRLLSEGAYKTNSLVLVEDASGDPTFEGSGGMAYLFNKVTQVFTPVFRIGLRPDDPPDWGEVKNKPQSSVEQIDQAVDKTHTHGNSDVLDDLSEFAIEDKAFLTYKGMAVGVPFVLYPDW